MFSHKFLLYMLCSILKLTELVGKFVGRGGDRETSLERRRIECYRFGGHEEADGRWKLTSIHLEMQDN